MASFTKISICCWLLLKWFIICFLFMVIILGFAFFYELQIVCIIIGTLFIWKEFSPVWSMFLFLIFCWALWFKVTFFIILSSNYFQIKSQIIISESQRFFVCFGKLYDARLKCDECWMVNCNLAMTYLLFYEIYETKIEWAEFMFFLPVLFFCLVLDVPWC